jgi:hypothetical protein
MTKLKAALRKVLRTYLNTKSPSHESLLTSRRHYRRTDNIQRRRAAVTWCPTYSLGLSIEVGRYECVKTCKNSLCRITRAIKMCCFVRDAHSHHSTRHSRHFNSSNVTLTETPQLTWSFSPIIITEDMNISVLSEENEVRQEIFSALGGRTCQA